MAMSKVIAPERVPPVFDRPYGDEDEMPINPDRPCRLKAVVIGSVHPMLAHNCYTEKAKDRDSLSYEIEVKYFPCEGIDYVEHTFGTHSLWGAAWVVLRTLGADLLEVEWRKELKLHPELACEDVPWSQVQAARNKYLDGLVLKYVAMSKYLHDVSLGCSKILQVAVIIPTLGDIYSYNNIYGEADWRSRSSACVEPALAHLMNTQIPYTPRETFPFRRHYGPSWSARAAERAERVREVTEQNRPSTSGEVNQKRKHAREREEEVNKKFRRRREPY